MIEGKKMIHLGVVFFLVVGLIFFVFAYPFKKEGNRTMKGEVLESHKFVALPVKKDFFIEYRLDRERLRSQQSELLAGIVKEQGVDAAARKEAANRLEHLSETAQKELQIEQMIKAKGYEEALAVVNKECADVIIRAKSLSSEDVALIGALVAKNTGLALQQIVIMCKAS